MAIHITCYADWVYNEVFSATPEQKLRTDWIPRWKLTLAAIRDADGIFELISLICARWEFLGALHCGTTGKTDVDEAKKYVKKFLEPFNSEYSGIHDISGPNVEGSDFFSTFRNKPLHGMTPSAIVVTTNTKKDVVGWIVGFSPVYAKNHLKISEGTMYVDGNRFYSEFFDSLNRFADYLEENSELLDGQLPVARWQRALWARFKPLYLNEMEWLGRGNNRGVPG